MALGMNEPRGRPGEQPARPAWRIAMKKLFISMAEKSAYAAVAGLAKMALTGVADTVSIVATGALAVIAIVFAAVATMMK